MEWIDNPMIIHENLWIELLGLLFQNPDSVNLLSAFITKKEPDA